MALDLKPGQYEGAACKRGHPGLRYTRTRNCVHCDNERHTRLRAETPEVHLARARRYAERHPERRKTSKRKHWLENLDTWRLYREERRARLRGLPGTFTLADLDDLWTAQGGHCARCEAMIDRRGAHLDHKIPVSWPGASNWPTNLQWLCKPCNLSKGARYAD